MPADVVCAVVMQLSSLLEDHTHKCKWVLLGFFFFKRLVLQLWIYLNLGF